MTLTQRIRQICEERNLSINQIEVESGIGRGNIARWDDHSPSIDKVQKVATYLNMSVSDLIDDSVDGISKDTVDLLSNLRDSERALLQVTRGMTSEQVMQITEFVKSLKGEP